MSPPQVSVVIPTRNRRVFLQQAVESCFAGNDGLAVEVVVVDDGSTDGSAEWVEGRRDARIRLLRQEHQGPQAARNRGLAAAGGTFVKFLDDDDWLAPGALCRACAAAIQDVDIVSVDIAVVREPGKPLEIFPTAPGDDLFVLLARGRTTSHPLRFLLRTELARRVAWDAAVSFRQDVDYFFRIGLAAVRHAAVPEVMGYFRQHDGPRVSTTAALNGPRQQLALLARIAEECFTPPASQKPERVDALREALWQAAHQCAVADWPAAVRAWQIGDRLGRTRYLPPRTNRFARWSDRVLGMPATERLLLWPRRLRRLWAAR